MHFVFTLFHLRVVFVILDSEMSWLIIFLREIT
jgi:hypothetical protein